MFCSTEWTWMFCCSTLTVCLAALVKTLNIELKKRKKYINLSYFCSNLRFFSETVKKKTYSLFISCRFWNASLGIRCSLLLWRNLKKEIIILTLESSYLKYILRDRDFKDWDILQFSSPNVLNLNLNFNFAVTILISESHHLEWILRNKVFEDRDILQFSSSNVLNFDSNSNFAKMISILFKVHMTVEMRSWLHWLLR